MGIEANVFASLPFYLYIMVNTPEDWRVCGDRSQRLCLSTLLSLYYGEHTGRLESMWGEGREGPDFAVCNIGKLPHAAVIQGLERSAHTPSILLDAEITGVIILGQAGSIFSEARLLFGCPPLSHRVRGITFLKILNQYYMSKK